MGFLRTVFTTGLGLIGAGFVLMAVSVPLGLGLAQLGMILISGVVVLPVIAVVLAAVTAVGRSQSEQARPPQDQQRPKRSPRRSPDRVPPWARAEQKERAERPDLDVASIKDYRR